MRNFSEVYKKGIINMSDLYNRIDFLCKNEGLTITSMCKISGASRASLSDLNKGRKQSLSAETLSKISKTLGVSVSLLLGHDPAWEKAINHFGFCWDAPLREKKKEAAREIVNNESFSIFDRVNAQITVFKALFSRSLMQNNFSLEHPCFEDYCAMLLNQGAFAHSVPEVLYDFLVEKFGTMEGIESGTYYYEKKRAPQAIETAQKELPNYYKLTEENKRKAMEYIDLLLNSQ